MAVNGLDILTHVCSLLASGQTDSAMRTLRNGYPFEPVQAVERKYGAVKAMQVFIRDGFIDRYSGNKLIFPGTLRLISCCVPREFPFYPNWKMSETHAAYWELAATIDHVLPVARGGTDDESNLVTTSMLRNSAKANWTIQALGWRMHEPGDPAESDGLLGWFLSYCNDHPDIAATPSIRRWYAAASAVAGP